MFHKRFLAVAVVALIVLGLLFAAGSAIQRSAWSQGYMMGRLAAGGEDGAVAPYALYGPGYPGGRSMCGLGPILTVGTLLVLLAVVGKFFRFRAWRKADGPEGERWARHWAEHWRRHHDHSSPWCWGDEKPSEKAPDKAEADAGNGEAAAEG